MKPKPPFSMKMPGFILGASSLILVLTWLPDAQAQDEALPSAATAPTSTPVIVSAPLSRASAAIVKLAAAGIETNVLLNFIATLGAFGLNSEQINRLAALGVSAPIITAMVQHDEQLAMRAPAALAADEAGATSTAAPRSPRSPSRMKRRMQRVLPDLLRSKQPQPRRLQPNSEIHLPPTWESFHPQRHPFSIPFANPTRWSSQPRSFLCVRRESFPTPWSSSDSLPLSGQPNGVSQGSNRRQFTANNESAERTVATSANRCESSVTCSNCRQAFNPEVFKREEEKMQRKKLARRHNTAAALGLKLVPAQ